MAKYTLELRQVIDEGIDIFNFKYPFYDESKRNEFQEHFIRHFYFREIGQETIDRFLHYLEDKFNTVFPYYNKLFEASKIEYSILDNYKLEDNYTITRENVGHSKGQSYSVGQVIDEQKAELEHESNANGKTTTTGEENETKRETKETSGTGKTTENNSQNVNETKERNANTSKDVKTIVDESFDNSGQETNSETTKFLDTPTGNVDLDNNNYLTNLTNKNGGGSKQEFGNKDVTQTTEESTTERAEENGNATTEESKLLKSENTEDTTNKGEAHATNNTESESEESTSGKQTSNTRNEQKATNDNNNIVDTFGTQKETYKQLRIGNIGIDTDSDMINKHIKLQQILTKIELMFFDECEDLFMGVF